MVGASHDLEQLVHDYWPLALSIASRYSRRVDPIWREDVYSQAFMGLWRAAQAYEPDRGAFGSLARACITNEIRHFFRWLYRRWEPERYSTHETTQPDGEETFEDVLPAQDCNVELKILLEDALSRSPELRLYADGYTLAEISTWVGCHRQTAFNRMSRARTKLASQLAG